MPLLTENIQRFRSAVTELGVSLITGTRIDEVFRACRRSVMHQQMNHMVFRLQATGEEVAGDERRIDPAPDIFTSGFERLRSQTARIDGMQQEKTWGLLVILDQSYLF